MNRYVRILNIAIISILLTSGQCWALFGQGTDKASVGTDWTDTDKSLSTTGDVTADEITATTGVTYNQGDTNAVDTYIETKMRLQMLDASDFTSLALAVSDIGSVNNTRLSICDDEVIADGTTVTVTSNMILDLTCGGTIDGVSGGGTETLTLQEGTVIIADQDQQIFGANLAVNLPPGLRISSRWFGDDGDDIMRAITAGSSSGTYVYVPAKTTTYEATAAWDWETLAKPITLECQQLARNDSDAGTEIEFTQTDGTNGINWGAQRITIKNCKFIGNSSSGIGINQTTSSANASIHSVEISGFGTDGWHSENLYNSTFEDCNFVSNGTSGTGYNLYLDEVNNTKFQGLLSNGPGSLYVANAEDNKISADLNTPSGNYGVAIEDYSIHNEFVFWLDGTAEKIGYLSTLTYGNEVWYHSGLTRGMLDLGVDNIINGASNHSKQAASVESFPPMINRIRNSSALQGTGGWTANAGLTYTRDTTTGGSTGTSHKIVLPQSTGNTNIWYQNLDDRPTYADGDEIVIRFLAKASRAPLVTETIFGGISGTGGAMPVGGYFSIDVTTDWRPFYYSMRIDGTPTTPYIYFRGWDIDASTITLYVTDITVVRNPGMPAALVPNIYSGNYIGTIDGDNGYWYQETTIPLAPIMQIPILEAEPQNVRPGMIAHADGFGWDPLSNGNNASYIVYYGQVELVNGANWTQSGAQNTEWYTSTAYTEPDEVIINGVIATPGTVGSLAVGEWDFADNDAIGGSRIYVRITGDGDPDNEDSGYVLARRWVGLTETDAK